MYESQEVILEKSKFECQDKLNDPAVEIKVLQLKFLIDNLITETQPLALGKSTFGFWEKTNPFALFGHSGPERFQCQDHKRKYRY